MPTYRFKKKQEESFSSFLDHFNDEASYIKKINLLVVLHTLLTGFVPGQFSDMIVPHKPHILVALHTLLIGFIPCHFFDILVHQPFDMLNELENMVNGYIAMKKLVTAKQKDYKRSLQNDLN